MYKRQTGGELVGRDVAAQTEQVISNLRAVLAAAGSSLERVVKTTVFLQSMACLLYTSSIVLGNS